MCLLGPSAPRAAQAGRGGCLPWLVVCSCLSGTRVTVGCWSRTEKWKTPKWNVAQASAFHSWATSLQITCNFCYTCRGKEHSRSYRYTKPNSGLAKIEYRYGEVGWEGEPRIPIMHCRLTDNKNLIFLSYLPSAFSPTTGSVWKTQISKDYHYDVPLQMQWWHLFAHNCLYCVKLTSCSCKTSQRPCPTLLHESRYTCYSCTYRTVSIL